MPPASDTPRSPVVVAGMHLSGTSLAARILAAGEVRIGEDPDLLDLSRAMLTATTPVDDGGHPDWGWTEHGRRRSTGLGSFTPRATELIAARTATRERWGWEDPRTTLLLEFWHPLLNNPAYLMVYRLPWAVADSMQRLGTEDFLQHPGHGLKLWAYYNRFLLDFHTRHHDRSLLVSADALIREPARFGELLEKRIGVRVPEHELRRLVTAEGLRPTAPDDPLVALLDAVHSESLELLRELDGAADLPAEGLWEVGAACGLHRRPSAPSRTPRLSVVIPCFNQGETLIEALASVERSIDEPVEVLIVNDGSDEPATLTILTALRKRGYDVRDQANAGVGAARIAGVAHTRAAAVLPLDADNALCPGFIAQALAVLEASPEVGVVYGDRAEFGLRSGVVDVPPFDLPTILTYNFIDACAVVRRSAWDAAGGYDPAPIPGWEDWDFWIAIAEHGWAFRHLPTPGFQYRVRPGSMITRTTTPGARRRLYQHVVGRHEALYREHLEEILMRSQSTVGELSSTARALESSHREVAARHEETQRLHTEVAARDKELRQLHQEVAVRDKEVRRLHLEVAIRDEQIRRLAALNGS